MTEEPPGEVPNLTGVSFPGIGRLHLFSNSLQYTVHPDALHWATEGAFKLDL